MTVDHHEIKSSFKKLSPYKARFAKAFYDELFLEYPELEKYFANSNLRAQREMLLGALALVVKFTAYEEPPPELIKHFKNLGTRHAKYKLQEMHFRIFVGQLLKTMSSILKDIWSKELEENWKTALWKVSLIMIAAMEIERLKNHDDSKSA